MPNYANGFIYKIVGNGLTYYGSSTKSSCAARMIQHRYDAKRSMESNDVRPSCASVACFLNGDARIELVEKFPCECRDELTKRERYYIENNECVNKNIPTRTRKEWEEEHKEELKEYKAEWNQAHYDPVKQKEKREQNKESIKERQKKYRDERRADPIKSAAEKEYKRLWFQNKKISTEE